MQSHLSIRNRQRTRRIDTRLLARIARALLRGLLQKDAFDFSICLVDAEEITRLNKQFLQHEGWTDVITFDYSDPAHPGLVAGEAFVCVEAAAKQAGRFRASWQSETVRYVVHGLLHLCGYDDRKPAARRKMKNAENRLLRHLSHRFSLQDLG